MSTTTSENLEQQQPPPSSPPNTNNNNNNSNKKNEETVLWSLEDGVRPSSITPTSSSKNLFGGGGGGFLNLPLPSNLMLNNTTTNKNQKSIPRKLSSSTSTATLQIDQTQPLPPLRAFLSNWNSIHNNNNQSQNQKLLNSKFDAVISFFSSKSIENICNHLQIETIEDFCCQPATKLSEASASNYKTATLTNKNTSANQRDNSNINSNVNNSNKQIVDPVITFLAISDAHKELKRVGAKVNWIHRLQPLYELYCPNRVSQLPMLLQAYSGEEESLWRSVREKYEHEYAVAAAVLEVQSQHELDRNAAAADDDEGEGEDDGTNNTKNQQKQIAQLQEQLQEQKQTISMLQQMYSQSQDDLRALANEYNEGMASLTDRAEKAEAEVGRLRLVNVEQLEWIKVLEQRLSAATQQQQNNNLGGGAGRTPSAQSSNIIMSPLASKILNSPQQRVMNQNTTFSSPSSASRSNHANNNNRSGSLLLMDQQSQANYLHQLRNRLTDFYSKYDPSRVPEVDAVMEQWRGKETELESLLETPPTS